MKIACVIPARYKSSRFPGKPLADIMGRPMIWWSYQNAKKNNVPVIVATDNEEIFDTCKALDMNVVMTSEKHPTGVDRLAEVAKNTDYDWYILVQGDEPLLEKEVINVMINKVEESPDYNGVRTFKTSIKNPVDAVNSTIIKIVTYYKSVGVYAYPRSILLEYPKLCKGDLEKAEDHDFMRMLENGIKIKAYEINTNTISVDTPKDLERVKRIMENRDETNI